MINKNCWYCRGTGKYKKPKDQESYDREFDRLSDVGSVSNEICEERAFKACGGYTLEDCPNCSKTECDYSVFYIT